MKRNLNIRMRMVKIMSSVISMIKILLKRVRPLNQQIFFDYSNPHAGALLCELYKSAPMQHSSQN